MLKKVVLAAAVVSIAAAFPVLSSKPIATTGSWHVDASHSDAQFTADGTTDFGKTPHTYTIGFARVSGSVTLDSADPSKSAFDLHIYPANSIEPPINEQGKVKSRWLLNRATQTLVCFHSKGGVAKDKGLQTSGELTLTRVDRNVEITPNEAYAGPVYGPPMIHHLTRPASFVFDFSPSGKGGAILTSGSTSVYREDFPQLARAVLGTMWPAVVQDKNCKSGGPANEAYSGALCTGTFLQAPLLPEAPYAGEDYPGPSDFNAVVGEHVVIQVRLQLKAQASAPATGN